MNNIESNNEALQKRGFLVGRNAGNFEVLDLFEVTHSAENLSSGQALMACISGIISNI